MPYGESKWHPILACVETTPGVWRMVAQYEQVYATVRFIRRGPELGYRVDDEHGELVGYYRTLRAAAMAGHRAYLKSMNPGWKSAAPTAEELAGARRRA